MTKYDYIDNCWTLKHSSNKNNNFSFSPHAHFNSTTSRSAAEAADNDPLSQQRRGKLLAMFWLDGASLYLVSVYMMASRIYKFSKIQNFQPQHQPQLGASFSHGLTSVSRVQRRVVILHAKTPIGAYNDVRVEVCIIILERVFHDVLLNSISHQKHLFFQIRSRIWTCGKVLFELDMPHVKQNPTTTTTCRHSRSDQSRVNIS